jgi:hypothetical protein
MNQGRAKSIFKFVASGERRLPAQPARRGGRSLSEFRRDPVSLFHFALNPAECVSPENNRQPEQDDCDRHERRAGDVSEQDEEDRDGGEDCCDVVVHSFPVVGLPTLPCDVIRNKVFRKNRDRLRFR